jgi:116 kDa U5 small nuclear ribonucleoprotein component
MFIREATKIYLLQGRYKLELDEAVAGNYVLISGIDQAITKTSTIVHASNKNAEVSIMSPLKYWTEPTIKVAI